jgi:hypothetical protein
MVKLKMRRDARSRPLYLKGEVLNEAQETVFFFILCSVRKVLLC